MARLLRIAPAMPWWATLIHSFVRTWLSRRTRVRVQVALTSLMALHGPRCDGDLGDREWLIHGSPHGRSRR